MPNLTPQLLLLLSSFLSLLDILAPTLFHEMSMPRPKHMQQIETLSVTQGSKDGRDRFPFPLTTTRILDFTVRRVSTRHKKDKK